MFGLGGVDVEGGVGVEGGAGAGAGGAVTAAAAAYVEDVLLEKDEPDLILHVGQTSLKNMTVKNLYELIVSLYDVYFDASNEMIFDLEERFANFQRNADGILKMLESHLSPLGVFDGKLKTQLKAMQEELGNMPEDFESNLNFFAEFQVLLLNLCDLLVELDGSNSVHVAVLVGAVARVVDADARAAVDEATANVEAAKEEISKRTTRSIGGAAGAAAQAEVGAAVQPKVELSRYTLDQSASELKGAERAVRRAELMLVRAERKARHDSAQGEFKIGQEQKNVAAAEAALPALREEVVRLERIAQQNEGLFTIAQGALAQGRQPARLSDVRLQRVIDFEAIADPTEPSGAIRSANEARVAAQAAAQEVVTRSRAVLTAINALCLAAKTKSVDTVEETKRKLREARDERDTFTPAEVDHPEVIKNIRKMDGAVAKAQAAYDAARSAKAASKVSISGLQRAVRVAFEASNRAKAVYVKATARAVALEGTAVDSIVQFRQRQLDKATALVTVLTAAREAGQNVTADFAVAEAAVEAARQALEAARRQVRSVAVVGAPDAAAVGGAAAAAAVGGAAAAVVEDVAAGGGAAVEDVAAEIAVAAAEITAVADFSEYLIRAGFVDGRLPAVPVDAQRAVRLGLYITVIRTQAVANNARVSILEDDVSAADRVRTTAASNLASARGSVERAEEALAHCQRAFQEAREVVQRVNETNLAEVARAKELLAGSQQAVRDITARIALVNSMSAELHPLNAASVERALKDAVEAAKIAAQRLQTAEAVVQERKAAAAKTSSWWWRSTTPSRATATAAPRALAAAGEASSSPALAGGELSTSASHSGAGDDAVEGVVVSAATGSSSVRSDSVKQEGWFVKFIRAVFGENVLRFLSRLFGLDIPAESSSSASTSTSSSSAPIGEQPPFESGVEVVVVPAHNSRPAPPPPVPARPADAAVSAALAAASATASAAQALLESAAAAAAASAVPSSVADAGVPPSTGAATVVPAAAASAAVVAQQASSALVVERTALPAPAAAEEEDFGVGGLFGDSDDECPVARM